MHPTITGIPIGQQILCFAGKDLKDHLTLGDHDLQQYTLSDEVPGGHPCQGHKSDGLLP